MDSRKMVLFEKIRASGLKVIGLCESASGITVDAAWRLIANFEVEPSATVPLEGDNTAPYMNRLWLQLAQDSGVIADDGSFLITVVTNGSRELGWVEVQLTPEADISRLRDDQGRVEFIARSQRGHYVCGVTAEEYDYWIVSLPVEN
jgi:hypothetical protein